MIKNSFHLQLLHDTNTNIRLPWLWIFATSAANIILSAPRLVVIGYEKLELYLR